jgi:hypothetical protein|tara:strand:- start:476 stop:703 length:228 start_codon:yes stop_codon:yes gene_type:complete
MKLLSYIVILIVISGCSLNKDSAYWTEDSIKKKADNIKLIKIIEKSNDIRSMTVEEYEIYIDDYVKKSKYPDINE